MKTPDHQSYYGDTHVFPAFGRAHEASAKCWCQPKLDPLTAAAGGRLWVHSLAN